MVQPSHFCKNLVLQVRNPKDSLVRGPIGNRFVDLSETGFLDLSETGSWTYLKPICGPNGNWFVDLTETGLCPAPKGLVNFIVAGRRRFKTGLWTYALTGLWGHSIIT